jgi:hypothetical protein
MIPIYKQLEHSIQKHDLVSLEKHLNSLKINHAILTRVLQKKRKYITFHIISTIFSHKNINRIFFSKKHFIEKKIVKIKEETEKNQAYNSAYYDYMINKKSEFLLYFIRLIIDKPKLIRQCISFVEKNEYYIEYDELIFLLFDNKNIELAIEFSKKNECFTLPHSHYNKERIEVFEKIKVIILEKNKIDNF